jgi:hypothetical protein
LGVDFISTCAPTFTRGWDIGLADIQTADLFTDLPFETSRTYRSTGNGVQVQMGDVVFLRSGSDHIVIVRGRTAIGTIIAPPPTLVDRLTAKGGGIATGTICNLHTRSGDFDILVN